MEASPPGPEDSPPEPVEGLSVTGLGWRPYGREHRVLSDVSLQISPGERVLLVGPSGSGKSTLLRALGGLLDESLGEREGAVTLDGSDPAQNPGRVGLLLQDPVHALVAEHAGRDAAFGPENRQLPPAEIRTKAAEALAAVDFPFGADHRSTELSGGQQQRLSLAGALALDPDVLLLDEPTAMLDVASAARVRDAVSQVADGQDLTLVVVEHRLEGWIDLCQRMVVLDADGRVLVDGPTDRVLQDHVEALLAAGIWVPGEAAPEPGWVDWGVTDQSRTGDVAFLSLRDLAVSAPGGADTLVDGLDLTLQAGDALAVTGPSGVGKSSLLRVLAGVRSPAAGDVSVVSEGTPTAVRTIASDSRRLARSLAWLPQQADQLWTRRTVLDEVLATSQIIFADEPTVLEAARERAERVLAALSLDHLREVDPHRLSGGEQRRLGLAVVVAHAPAVVLLDEPTVGQDRHTWAAVSGVVAALRREGAAVVAATHDGALISAMHGAGCLDLAAHHRTPEVGELEVADYRVTEVIERGAPPAGRCNPLALLIIALGAAVGSFFVSNWLIGLITLGVSVALAPLAVRAIRPTLLRLLPVGLAALMVGWSTLLFSSYGIFARQAWPLAGAEALRICCLVVPGALLIGVLGPSRLGDALAQRGHLPHRPVVAATSALLRLKELFDLWTQMGDIRRIRGLHPGRSLPGRVRHVGSMTFALLVSSLRSAQQMALSMDARGFAQARRRTFALPSPWQVRDWVCCLLAVALALLPWLLSRLLTGV